MTKLLCAVSLAWVVASGGTAVATERVTAAAIRQNLFATCFINDKEGWAVGDLGRIFHTTDGAKTWDRQTIAESRSFVSLACPDSQHLWAVGQAGAIVHSSDGGKTWQPQKSGANRQLLDVAFANTQRGIAVGDFGLLLRTEDGGTTWTKVPLPEDTKLPADVAEVVAPGDIVLYGVSFADPDHVWVVGEFGTILASADGGASWRPQQSPVETTLFGVSFADQQRGWAVGLESTLLVTTDGGASWRQTAIDTPKGFSLALYDIQVRGTYGWAVGNSGLLLNSKDSGATWQVVSVPVQLRGSWLRGVSLLADGRGFVVGARGLVLAADRDRFTTLRDRL
ncbi:MAG TPA: YCF48-related protein [Candidatus Margulisiibacteriota bacterium]|nr:YCF48-related protein [Candidatus Margulisiibacteriota bacterium]